MNWDTTEPGYSQRTQCWFYFFSQFWNVNCWSLNLGVSRKNHCNVKVLSDICKLLTWSSLRLKDSCNYWDVKIRTVHMHGLFRQRIETGREDLIFLAKATYSGIATGVLRHGWVILVDRISNGMVCRFDLRLPPLLSPTLPWNPLVQVCTSFVCSVAQKQSINNILRSTGEEHV